jgi:competence protein ComFC
MTASSRSDHQRPDHPAYRMYRLLWSAVDWLYPPYCGGCETASERWCNDCQSKTTPIDFKICSICGDFLLEDDPSRETGLCLNCRTSPPLFHSARSYAVFGGPLRKAIHRFKYRQDLGLGEVLSRYLVMALESLNWPVDLVIPVPLSPKRMKERGYNQSSLLARPVAYAFGVQFASSAVQRVRETRSQVGLSAAQRAENLKEAFSANQATVKGKTVLVIDDVMTTGVTLRNCAHALFQSGARDVFGLTLARAVIHKDGFEEDQTNSTRSSGPV